MTAESVPARPPEARTVRGAVRQPLTPVSQQWSAGDARWRADLPVSPKPHRVAEQLYAEFAACASSSLLLVDVQPSRQSAAEVVELARALGHRIDDRILLIDANLARKDLTKEFGLAEQPGLTETLNMGQNLHRMVVSGAAGALDVLPAGRGQLGANRDVDAEIGGILRQLASKYRFVLTLCGAPETQLARALGRRSDATYLVVRLDHTERAAAAAAVQQLASAGARLLGTLVAG